MLEWIFALRKTHLCMTHKDTLLLTIGFDKVALHRANLSAEDVILLR